MTTDPDRGDSPVAYTVPRAAASSGMSRTRLYQLMRSGELNSIVVGGRRLITRKALEDFFERKSS